MIPSRITRSIAAMALLATVAVSGCAASGSDATRPAEVGDTADPTAVTSGAKVIYDPSRDAQADIDAAQARAKANGTRVLVDFGADWCPDCVVLDQLFRSPEAQAAVDGNFEVVRVDVGDWDHNMELSDSYDHVVDAGIPAIVVLAPDGSVITTTADGSMADARTMDPDELAEHLETWAG